MKKRIWKTVVLVTAIILTLGVLGGCGADQNAENGQVVISVANFVDEKTNPEVYKSQMEEVAGFEAAYPNVKVEDARWDFNVDTFLAKAEGGTLPTLYYVPMTEAENIMNLDLAADLTDEFEKREMTDKLSEFILQKISKNNRIYLMPTSCYDVGIAVNIDLYDQAGFIDENGNLYQPETWEDLAGVAKKIKDSTGVDGFIFPTTQNNGGWRFTPIAWSYGTVFETQLEDGGWQATFNSPECVKAMQFVSDLKWKYDVLPENALISGTNTKEQFSAGNVAMTFAEPNYIIELVQNYGMDKNKIGMLGIPAGDQRRVSLMGGGFYVINKDSTPEQVSAAMNFIEYRGYTCNLTEERKETLAKDYETRAASGELIGLESISPWKAESEYGVYIQELNRENLNVDINHIKNYNDKTGLEFQQEEPKDAQALYAVFDNVIQEVLTNPDANIEGLIENAANDFQQNNLDYAN
ncbi:ABC transporter substrate-binding protein [Ructibacterium gallinarum]|uniref:Extracellular solute-binding protein n=1 Tax=Ructibacterium gallinarum TaxID=2779355 RepID=A0A9D5R8M3_9FIRM|nr:extracellular solute-binding protein [Ructibacterium gallinarum]MBE5039579.1 extracellular solute-binding protein [Ructibacterium gallinarum]